MSIKKAVTAGFIAGAVALAIAGATAVNAEETEAKEKCYGVVKAGHNDCGDAAKAHSCMSHATADGDKNEWISLPAGLCEKLAGGSLTPAGAAEVKAEDAAPAEAAPAKEEGKDH